MKKRHKKSSVLNPTLIKTRAFSFFFSKREIVGKEKEIKRHQKSIVSV